MGRRLPQYNLGLAPRRTITPMLSEEDLAYFLGLKEQAPSELQDANFNRELGDGEGRKTSGEINHSTSGQSKTTLPITREAYDAAVEYVADNPPPAMNQLGGDVDYMRGAFKQKLDDHLAREAAGHNLDMSPVLRTMDAWFGGNRAQGYVPPGARSEQQLHQLAQLLGQTQMGLSAQERQLLDSILGDQQVQQLRTELGMGRTFQEGTGAGINPMAILNYERQLAESARRAAERAEDKATRKAERDEDKAYQQEKDVSNELTKFVKDTEAIEELRNYFESLDELLGKYRGAKDLPGIGGVDSNTPAFWNALRQASGSEWHKDSETIKTIVRDIVAMRNRQLSGLQSTDREFNRALQNLGNSIGQGEHVMINALRRVQNAARNALRRREDTLTEAARGRYRNSASYIDPDSLRFRFGGPNALPPPPPDDAEFESRARQKLDELKRKRSGK